MPGIENIGEAIGSVVNWYEAHPRFRAVMNTALIYTGTAGLGVVAHETGYHDLEKIIDATNVAATGAYAMRRAGQLLPEGYSKDFLRAGIAAAMAFGAVGEARDLAFSYDSPDLASKALESLPIISRRDPMYETFGAIISGILYLVAKGKRGYNRTRHPVAHHAAHH